MLGFLAVNKPSGPTSHDVVNAARRLFKIKKVGHSGTLDPLASGLLILGIGKATRALEYFGDFSKEYIAEMIFGKSSDTLDIAGCIIDVSDASQLTVDQLNDVLPFFIGEIQQTPPIFSAIKQNGKPLYKLARQGIAVETKPRKIFVESIEILNFREGVFPEATIKVVCSSGAYIRSLCCDIGNKLGYSAVMKSLIRTRIGHFTLDKSIDIFNITEEEARGRVIDLNSAFPHMNRVDISSDDELKLFKNGNYFRIQADFSAGDSVKVVFENQVVGFATIIMQKGEKLIKPQKALI